MYSFTIYVKYIYTCVCVLTSCSLYVCLYTHTYIRYVYVCAFEKTSNSLKCEILQSPSAHLYLHLPVAPTTQHQLERCCCCPDRVHSLHLLPYPNLIPKLTIKSSVPSQSQSQSQATARCLTKTHTLTTTATPPTNNLQRTTYNLQPTTYNPQPTTHSHTHI